MHLLDYVKALENRDNQARGQQLLAILRTLGIVPIVQKWRWPRINNFIVDFSPGTDAKKLLFSAHYDAVRGSPGANDNASGVAVLLGLCEQIADVPAPVRVVFFDREEAWLRMPGFRLGALGSLYYVWKNGLRNVAAVCNLEFCGSGDCLAIWPVRNAEVGPAIVQGIERAAARISLPFRLASIPWLLFSSDHLPFRLRGMSNAVTLSLLPVSHIPVLESITASLSIPRLLAGQRPLLPEPLSFVHTARDTSSRLDESSLELMLSLLLELVRDAGFPESSVSKVTKQRN